ncbi:exported hypothetical protein [Streptomyces murinus]
MPRLRSRVRASSSAPKKSPGLHGRGFFVSPLGTVLTFVMPADDTAHCRASPDAGTLRAWTSTGTNR